MRVRIHRLDPSLPLPRYQTAGSVAFDVHARTDCVVEPKGLALIPTGLVVEVPHGYCLLLAARSSSPGKLGLHVPHGMGLIDQDFCGPDNELLVQYYNPGEAPVRVERGARIAQAMLVPVAIAEFEEVPAEGLTPASRGSFGSTGHT